RKIVFLLKKKKRNLSSGCHNYCYTCAFIYIYRERERERERESNPSFPLLVLVGAFLNYFISEPNTLSEKYHLFV
ncbi:MAG: hypothetical protein N7Q72_05995, partial [Spiroplasma sp. Tabriz.8]|nr:hypothetical protein [Spiroplasma sp. Tabriz.8]